MPRPTVTAPRTPRPARFVCLALAPAASGCAPTAGVVPGGPVTDAHLAPLVSTFSIVAVDTLTGEVGVAVQSKSPNVRAVVPWAQGGAGPWRRRRSPGSTTAARGWS